MRTIVPHVTPPLRQITPHANTAPGLFVGLSTIDVVHLVASLPQPNRKMVALDSTIAAGGPATNAAVAFAHCGANPTLVTALPEHALTDVITNDLQDCGVEVVIARRYQGAPVTASILVEAATGDRAIVSPTSAAASAALSAGAALPRVEDFAVVLTDGYFPDLAVSVAARARKAGIPVVLDGGSFKDHTPRVLAHTDVAIVSADFHPHGTVGTPDEVFAYLRANGVRFAAITRGAEPLLWRSPSGHGEVRVETVPAIDTLGAGDFFHGAFAARVASSGLSESSFADDLTFASRVAGASLKSFGTRQWLNEPLTP